MGKQIPAKVLAAMRSGDSASVREYARRGGLASGKVRRRKERSIEELDRTYDELHGALIRESFPEDEYARKVEANEHDDGIPLSRYD